MASLFDDDNSRASSDNDADEDMEDLDGGEADMQADVPVEAENDMDNQESYDDDDQDDTQEMDESPSRPFARSSTKIADSKNKDTLHAQSSRTPVDGRQSAVDGDKSRTASHRNSPFHSDIAYWTPSVRPEALSAASYDIVPTIAAPQSTSINTVTATPDMKWVFSGGSDGWIRRFNWVDTVNSKTLLTVAQRQPFVDSVVKCGVLVGYWENEETRETASAMQYSGDGPSLSPVYSLAVHHQALWLLSGTESGAINLQSVRHDEGKRITSLYKHTSAVSVMSLSSDEASLLTGSWDKTIHDWDLHTGQVKRSFLGSGSQISALEMRPNSTVPIPRDFTDIHPPSATFSSDAADKPKPRGSMSNSAVDSGMRRPSEFAMGSPNDSLFGSNNSLFGDNDLPGDGLGTNAGLNFDEEDTEIAQALAENIGQEDVDTSERKSQDNSAVQEQTNAQQEQTSGTEHNLSEVKPSAEAEDYQAPVENPATTDTIQQSTNGDGEGSLFQEGQANGQPQSQDENAMQVDSHRPNEDTTMADNSFTIKTADLEQANDEIWPRNGTIQDGLPHAEELPLSKQDTHVNGESTQDPVVTSESTFLDSAIDGTLRIWDRRQPSPIARMAPRNTPPWCMHACWSHDGNFVYAGRRNGTVDEYSVHKGLQQPLRTLSFPGGSGAVSGVRAMPNGRHLICASYDILRLYDLKDEENQKKSTVPFLIVPGHRTGVVSQLYIDPTCTYLISTGGNRGWDGSSSEVLLGYEIGIVT